MDKRVFYITEEKMMKKEGGLRSLIEKHKSVAATDGEAKALDSIFGELEKFIEDTGQSEQFQVAYTNFIAEKTNEIISIRCARRWMLRLGALMCILVLSVFYYIVLYPADKTHLTNMPDAAKVAFISASFASSFGLVAIILRGILVGGSNKEEVMLPENIKLLAQIFREEIIK